MSESTHNQFKRLICALLKRDGVEVISNARILTVHHLHLQIREEEGYLFATLPSKLFGSGLLGMRLQVYNTLDDEYSIPHMSELIPKLNRMLILERLSDV